MDHGRRRPRLERVGGEVRHGARDGHIVDGAGGLERDPRVVVGEEGGDLRRFEPPQGEGHAHPCRRRRAPCGLEERLVVAGAGETHDRRVPQRRIGVPGTLEEAEERGHGLVAARPVAVQLADAQGREVAHARLGIVEQGG